MSLLALLRLLPCRVLRWMAASLAGGLLAASAVAQDLALRAFTHADGLANLAVTALVETPDGRLWIGTENGLYRHEGARIIRVDAPDAPMATRFVAALASDGRGGLWVGMGTGVFHLGDRGLQAVDTGGKRLLIRQGQQAIAATADGGALVAAVDGLHAVQRDRASGAWRVSPAVASADLAREPSLAAIHAVMVEPDGTWWLTCGDALCRRQAGQWRRFGEREGLKPMRWAGLLRARDGALWVRSQTQVLRQTAADSRFENVTPDDLSRGTVHLQLPLAEDADGRVLTSSDSGLLRWQSGRWERFGAAQGLAGLHAILVDRHQEVWLGSAGQGLLHWRGYRHWRHWTGRQGLPDNDVWTFLETEPGQLWIGTGHGAALLARASGSLRAVPQDGTRDQVGSFTRDASGQLWMATFSGEVFRRRAGGHWQRVARGLPLVLTLAPAADGGVWIGTDKGLYAMPPAPPDVAAPEVRLAPGMAPARAGEITVYTACTTPRGPTWLGTSEGLFMEGPLTAGTNAGAPDALGLKRAVVRGLPDGEAIEKLACGHDGSVFAASRDHRLWRVHGDRSGWRADPVQPGEVLGRRSVMAVLADRRGWLWVTTDDGVLVGRGKYWRRFDDSNGLVWNDCNQNALYEDSAGDVWIGTSRGASQVTVPDRLLDPVGASLRFTQVTRDEQPLPLDGSWTGDWSAGDLRIAWTVPSYVNRSSLQVRYRLRGLSEQWSTTRHDDASFTALPGGRYVFEARAENPDLGLVSDVATLSFVIRPPWWRSGWAIAGYCVAVAGLALFAHRWRVRAWVRRQRQLEALVGQRTAELQDSYEQMRTLALTDGLTGAMNRRAITEMATRELARARRQEAPLTLMLIDLDHFKDINDTHGHPAGDAVLMQLVQRLREAMRDYDAIGRWGGEEFLLVLPGLSLASEEGRRRAEALQRGVAEQPFDIATGVPLPVTCSAGAVGVPAAESDTLEALISRVDAALYEAKHRGRNRTVIAG